MANVMMLRESLIAHKAALQHVQLAIHSERNDIARRELMVTWSRRAEKIGVLRIRINQARLSRYSVR
jgi:hypothetical protein